MLADAAAEATAAVAPLAHCRCRVGAVQASSDSGKLASLFAAVGEAVGSITAALQEFQHSAATREFVWDLQRCFEVVESHIGDVKEGQQQDLVRRVLDAQRLQLTSLLPKLRRSIVHNDPNDYNLVVGVDGRVGVLDFGDMLYSYTCSDAAIGMAYLFFHVPEHTPLAEGVRPFVEAYHQKCPLEEAEADALFALAVCRVCTSVCMSAYQSRLDPGNEYLLISAKPAWRQDDGMVEGLLVRPLALSKYVVISRKHGGWFQWFGLHDVMLLIS
ncbi:Hykk [Symbiodinium sp. CCMP2456]|nr:Hykk [Symbiodinium sp. CCMP2456]